MKWSFDLENLHMSSEKYEVALWRGAQPDTFSIITVRCHDDNIGEPETLTIAELARDALVSFLTARQLIESG
jgi:hypothetical protein